MRNIKAKDVKDNLRINREPAVGFREKSQPQKQTKEDLRNTD